MVRTFQKFVKSALQWCWSTLLRSLVPSVRTLAISPLNAPEKVLGSFSRFRLSSVITSAPVEEASEIRRMLDAERVAFADGLLFRSLEVIGRSGAVMVTHITERGFINAEHFLAVYPADGLTQQRKPDTDSKGT